MTDNNQATKKLRNAKQWRYQGDMSPLNCGGKFIRHVGQRRFHVVEIINWLDATGEKLDNGDLYTVALHEVNLDAAKIDDALECSGWSGMDKSDDFQLAEAVDSYGQTAPLGDWHGNNGWKLIRQAKAESLRLEGDPEEYEARMERPVNRLGATAREFQRGEIIPKSVAAPAVAQPGAVVKTIHQGNLTSECWLIQMWGKGRCDTCEARGTDDCGGKKILETGKNEKGIAVPVG